MATISPPKTAPRDVYSESAVPTHPTYFNSTQRDELLSEDYVAGRNVGVILSSIITGAMVAGMGVVAWIALTAR